MSARPASGTLLCRVDEIEDPGAKGFVFGANVERWEMFVVRIGDRVYGYENACPHIGTPLETFADQFLTPDRRQILCTTHGARFMIETGACVSGPCRGDALRAVALEIADGNVRVGKKPGEPSSNMSQDQSLPVV